MLPGPCHLLRDVLRERLGEVELIRGERRLVQQKLEVIRVSAQRGRLKVRIQQLLHRRTSLPNTTLLGDLLDRIVAKLCCFYIQRRSK